MGEGWETARRRDDGNDWVEVRLAARGTVRVAELDTTWFLGNAPGAAALSAHATATGRAAGRRCSPGPPLQPDTRHRFVLSDAAGAGDPRAARRLPGRRHGPAAALGHAHRATGWPRCATAGTATA